MANPFLEKAKSSSAAKLQRMTGKSEGAQPHVGGKAGEMEEAASMAKARNTKKKKVAKRADGGKVVGDKSKPRLDKFARGGAVPKKADGGKVKKGTTININVAPKGPAPGEAASGVAAAPPPPPPEAMPPAPPPEAMAPPMPPPGAPPAVPPIDQTPPGMPPAAGAPPELIPGMAPEQVVALIKTLSPDQIALLPRELIMTLEQAGIIPPGGGGAGGPPATPMAPPPVPVARGGRVQAFKKGGKVKETKKKSGGSVPKKRFGGGDPWPLKPPPSEPTPEPPPSDQGGQYEFLPWLQNSNNQVSALESPVFGLPSFDEKGRGADHPLFWQFGAVPKDWVSTDDEYYKWKWTQREDQRMGQAANRPGVTDPESGEYGVQYQREMYPVMVRKDDPTPPTPPVEPPDDRPPEKPDDSPPEDGGHLMPVREPPFLAEGPPGDDAPTGDPRRVPMADMGLGAEGPLGLRRHMLADGGKTPDDSKPNFKDKKGFFFDPLAGQTPDPENWPSKEEIRAHNKYIAHRSNPAAFGAGMFGLAKTKNPWKNAYTEAYNIIPLPEAEFWNDPVKIGYPVDGLNGGGGGGGGNGTGLVDPGNYVWSPYQDGGEVPDKQLGGLMGQQPIGSPPQAAQTPTRIGSPSNQPWPMRPPRPQPAQPTQPRGRLMNGVGYLPGYQPSPTTGNRPGLNPDSDPAANQRPQTRPANKPGSTMEGPPGDNTMEGPPGDDMVLKPPGTLDPEQPTVTGDPPRPVTGDPPPGNQGPQTQEDRRAARIAARQDARRDARVAARQDARQSVSPDRGREGQDDPVIPNEPEPPAPVEAKRNNYQGRTLGGIKRGGPVKKADGGNLKDIDREMMEQHLRELSEKEGLIGLPSLREFLEMKMREREAPPKKAFGGKMTAGAETGLGRMQKAGITSRISPKKPSKSGTIGVGGNQLMNKSRMAGRQVGGGKKGIIAKANKIKK